MAEQEDIGQLGIGESKEAGDNDGSQTPSDFEEDIFAASPEYQAAMREMAAIINTSDNVFKKKYPGVIWKHLTVKGVGLGVTTNQTFGGLFLAPFQKLRGAFSHRAPIPLRELLHDFTGMINEGEMVLVLGPPGSGCTTFLKTIACQTESYKSVEGEISYGGLTPKEIQKFYRGQVVYNQGMYILFHALVLCLSC